jgi:hypothetical protein
MRDADELRAAGSYRLLTPAEAVIELHGVESPSLMFHPLCGGIPPTLGWESLHLFEQSVLPALRTSGEPQP